MSHFEDKLHCYQTSTVYSLARAFIVYVVFGGKHCIYSGKLSLFHKPHYDICGLIDTEKNNCSCKKY